MSKTRCRACCRPISTANANRRNGLCKHCAGTPD